MKGKTFKNSSHSWLLLDPIEKSGNFSPEKKFEIWLLENQKHTYIMDGWIFDDEKLHFHAIKFIYEIRVARRVGQGNPNDIYGHHGLQ